ncbi:MAG: ribonuclease Z [Bacteroidota bacterium]|uniref:Uncharacterized protein n=1 Tax=Christiangramia flava JLT2011 TaxID=1229726 RepID=A0A1L7IAR7_9FLAO|nr:ribonuclease Z [Christiangramia flava]APU70303.1 hypothetical protein GRFL_3579 [Christiangramia flava JLT2011]MAM20247.1 ribonuclease Z [Christiangramia sp.]MEE2773191.1 ribonuclease Z [Bacteroidota bacterium]OSS37546.1 hypothetical protein C723_3517 [Christiangramia flava JLT2011]
MKFDRKENYVLIAHKGGSITEFISALTKHHEEIEQDNVVVDLSHNPNVTSEHLMGFLEIAELYRTNNRSFVIISDQVSIDDLPEELVVVPTSQEAEDMIQMDEIQRDLGF